jgi:hypothetical protein
LGDIDGVVTTVVPLHLGKFKDDTVDATDWEPEVGTGNEMITNVSAGEKAIGAVHE